MDPDKAYKYSPVTGNPLTRMNKQHLVDEDTGFNFFITPKLGTGVIILNEDGQILLGKRSQEPYKDYWNLPGGHIDIGETAEDCIKREVEEEIGVTLSEFKLFKTYTLKYSSQGINYDMLGIFFIANIDNETSQELIPGDDMSEIKFFTPKDIPFELLAGDANKNAIKDYLGLYK